MLESFLATLSPMLIMFSCLFIGFSLNKLKLVPADSPAVLSKLENYVFMPALNFATFAKYCSAASLRENSRLLLYASLALGLALIIARPLSGIFERQDSYKRNIYNYALTFGNYGFMGNAIVPLILGGDEHLYKYLLFTLPISFVTYSWGITILTPKQHRSGNLLKRIINPTLVALFLGIIAGLTSVQAYFPSFIMETVDSLRVCMGPIAMLLAGIVIGNYSWKALLSDKKVYLATLLRLLILPAAIVTVLYLCKADPYTVTLAFFAFATPLGLNTVVFPAAFGGDTRPGASMATISHVLCVITIPLLYGLLQLLI